MTFEQGLIAAVGALAVAVVALWRKGEVAERRCDEDRARLWEFILGMKRHSCSVEECDERVPLESPKLKDLLTKKKVAHLSRQETNG